MFAPILRILSTPEVLAIVGSPARIYHFGNAPQGVLRPYITWFVVVSDPYSHLSGPPGADMDVIQIDCWAGPDDYQDTACLRLARAARDALELAGQSCRVIANRREPDTGLFHIGLQVDFIHNR